MNKKKIVFWRAITNDPVLEGFSTSPEYHAFFAKCNEVFEFRFARGKESYLGNGLFKDVLSYNSGRIVPAESEFKADAIYQFLRVADESFDKVIPIVNTPEFKNWCSNKWNQYELLKDFMPKTFLIEQESDLEKYLPLITTAKAVLKPRKGQKGENVTVFEITKVPVMDQTILTTKGYLLQEFSDTNITISGVVSGTHDLKLLTIDDKVFANLRTPEIGDVCTFDSPYTEVAIDALPKDVIPFQKKVKEIIDNAFPGQLYTIDIGITNKGPIIFELNGHTAFPYINFEYAQDFFDAMIDHLQKM